MRTVRTAISLLTVCVLAACLYGQATTSSTTAAAAIGATDSYIYVASATGIAAPASGASVGSVLVIDQEVTYVRSVSGVKIGVIRGQAGTRAVAHASGATVWIGAYNYFAASDPPEGGACTATDEVALPLVVPNTGHIWDCASSVWTRLSATRGTPETGVTAVDYGDGGKHHVTKLSFTDLTIGQATEAATALGFGKKLYTLPTGALAIRAASMSIALTGSGTGCDSDTPDGGLGTVVATGAVATLDGTATFEDILTGQTFNNLTGTAEVKTVAGQPVAIESAGAHTVYFNLADTWTATAACTVTATGTVVLEWTELH